GWRCCGGARLEMKGVVAAAMVVLLEAGAARGGECLHQSVEYKRPLGEVFSLANGKGFIDGLSVGRKDEDVQPILEATPGVDLTSSDTFMREYNKVVDKKYPYVDKVARAYLLHLTGLQNVMPDGIGPTPGQGPRDTPTASYA
nr:hypothetical protein [Tanacetum cinerariifolium]